MRETPPLWGVIAVLLSFMTLTACVCITFLKVTEVAGLEHGMTVALAGAMSIATLTTFAAMKR